MLIHFSLSTLLMSFLFSNLLLLLLWFIINRSGIVSDVGYRLLWGYLTLILLRFLFPFEIIYSKSIPLPEFFSRSLIFLKKTYSFWGIELSVWKIFLILWLLGSIVMAVRKWIQFHCYRRYVFSRSQNITKRQPIDETLQYICNSRGKKNRFWVLQIPDNISPCIFGFIRPCILLPDYLSFDGGSDSPGQSGLSHAELYYILCHETSHYFRHDLWKKLFAEILCVIYWWNPIALLLRNQVDAILDIQIDLHIVGGSDHQQKLDYMACLTKVIELMLKRAQDQSNHWAISFCRGEPTLLHQRFEMIAKDGKRQKSNRGRQFLFTALMVGIYLFSMVFIFEPHYIDNNNAEDSFQITQENAYLIINPAGGYDLYVNHAYMETLYELDDSLLDLKIYKSQEEVTHE